MVAAVNANMQCKHEHTFVSCTTALPDMLQHYSASVVVGTLHVGTACFRRCVRTVQFLRDHTVTAYQRFDVTKCQH